MPAADKQKLKKEIEKFTEPIKRLKRDDLLLGRWFGTTLDRTLGAQTAALTPKDVRDRWKGNATNDELANDIASTFVHEAIAATEAYQENLTPTEVKNLKEKKPGGEQRLAGDTVWLVAEVFYVVKLAADVIFNIAAAYEKQVLASQHDLFLEAFARALGNLDYDKAKEAGNLPEQIGAKIYDRAVVQTVGSSLGEALRKGFYCYYVKAIAKEARGLIEPLPKWEPPKLEEPAAPAMGGDMTADEPTADEEPPAY